jgi:hypothetical protein
MIRVVHPGSRIQMLTFYPSRIRNTAYPGVCGSGGRGLGLFLIVDHWPKGFGHNLTQKGPAKCVYCVRCTLVSPAAEICARLAGNFCHWLTTVKSGANGMVWLNV